MQAGHHCIKVSPDGARVVGVTFPLASSGVLWRSLCAGPSRGSMWLGCSRALVSIASCTVSPGEVHVLVGGMRFTATIL